MGIASSGHAETQQSSARYDLRCAACCGNQGAKEEKIFIGSSSLTKSQPSRSSDATGGQVQVHHHSAPVADSEESPRLPVCTGARIQQDSSPDASQCSPWRPALTIPARSGGPDSLPDLTQHHDSLPDLTQHHDSLPRRSFSSGGSACSETASPRRSARSGQSEGQIRISHISSCRSMKSLLITSESRFPTYCMPMEQFCQLELMAPHEQVKDKLFVPSSEVVHFISHEWLGFHHPDPDGIQLQHMHSAFATFRDGKARSMFHPHDWEAFLDGISKGSGGVVRQMEGALIVRDIFEEEDVPEHITGGCVWLDYHSIPQVKQTRAFLDAVNSIAHYVERCDYFWICAPVAVHHDVQEPRNFYSWKGRGWCRLEEMINLFSKTLKMPLIVTNKHNITTMGFLDGVQWLFNRPERSVGNGKFTCCLFDHKIKQADGTFKHIKCDRDAIAPVLVSVFESLYKQVTGEGDQFKRNLLSIAAPSVFVGLEKQCPTMIEAWKASNTESIDDFLSNAAFESLDSLDGLGWPPLVYAATCGSIKLVKEMTQLRPDMLFIRPETQMSIISVSVHRSPDDFKALLDVHQRARTPAELNHPSRRGYTAVDRAAKFGFHENLRYLLELRADVDPRRQDNGCTPLLSAAGEGYPRCCEVLLSFRADINAKDNHGQTVLHLAACFLAPCGNPVPGARVAALKVLLDAAADPLVVDNDGLTARDIAVKHSFHEAAHLLLTQESR